MNRDKEIANGLNLNSLEDIIDFIIGNQCDEVGIIEGYEEKIDPMEHIHDFIKNGTISSAEKTDEEYDYDIAYLTWIYVTTYHALYRIGYRTGDFKKWQED